MKQIVMASCVRQWENDAYAITSECAHKKSNNSESTTNLETRIFCKKSGVGYKLNTDLSDLTYPEEKRTDEEDADDEEEDADEAGKYFDLYVDDRNKNTFLLRLLPEVIEAVLDCHFEAINGALSVVCGYIDWNLQKKSAD